MDRARALTVGAAAAVIVGGLSVTQAVALDEPSCAGQTPTIVGEPRQPVVGTDGDDVIYASAPASVDARAGDDTICVVPDSKAPVLAGDGDDAVYILSSVGDDTHVELGAGRDTFWGNDGREQVATDGETSELDVVHTNGLADLVISGVDGQPNADVVDLGGGDDGLIWRGLATQGGALDGGGGTDTLRTGVDTVKVDTRHHQLTTGDRGHLGVHGFERHILKLMAEVTFVGGAGADDVIVRAVDSVTARLGPGADRLRVSFACLERAGGGGGADLIRLREQACGSAPLVHGGGGDDRMTGTDGADVLIGGSGRDRANGREGRDRCVAEVRLSCELGR